MPRSLRLSSAVLAAVAVGSLTLTACGGSSTAGSTASAGPTSGAAAPATGEAATGQGPAGAKVAAQPSLVKLLPAAIKKSGQLRLGISLGSAPDEFRDTNGAITGWEPDLMQGVASALGLKLTYEPTSFDGLIPGLQANRFDAAVGEMGVTKVRLKVVDFVSTILGNELFIVNKSSNITVPNLQALCGKSVGTIRGSVEAQLAQTQSAKCKTAGKQPVGLQVFQDSNQAGEALRAGRVQVFWDGSTVGNYFISKSNGAVKKVGSYGEPYPWGIAMAKNSGLQKPIQGAVQYLIDSGAYGKVMAKWGLSDEGIKHAQIDPKTSK